MRHLGPGSPRCERRAARVSEQVQHLGCKTSRSDHLPAVVVDEIPVGRLLGEDTHVFERREGQPHAQPHLLIGILHHPAVGHLLAETPLPVLVAARVAQERSVGRLPPLFFGECPPPDGLRLGTARHIAPETFQFLEIARVEQFIIPEIGCKLFLHKVRIAIGYKLSKARFPSGSAIRDISHAAQSNSSR